MGRALWSLADVEPSEAEKRHARQVQRLLYALVAILIVVPVVIFILRLP
ncbi:MAG: hypothetical protein HZC55_21165 [Verrucomicrobia bacterium]|nr:hypothetical protein [Verrucomicrobiota bacterium]